MIRALYDWTMRLAERRRATYALGAVSFADSSVFPVPPDVVLVPMLIADRRRAWRLALICTVASVLGGLAGYLIGRFLFDEIGWSLLRFYGYDQQFLEFADTYNEWGVWIVLIAGGLTPLPFKVVTIASGATGLNLGVFLLSSIVARASRFYAVAALLYWFGPPVKEFIDRQLKLVVLAGVVLIVGGFVMVRYLM